MERSSARCSPSCRRRPWLPALAARLTFPPAADRLWSFMSYVVGASGDLSGCRRRSHVNDVKAQQPSGFETRAAHKATKESSRSRPNGAAAHDWIRPIRGRRDRGLRPGDSRGSPASAGVDPRFWFVAVRAAKLVLLRLGLAGSKEKWAVGSAPRLGGSFVRGAVGFGPSLRSRASSYLGGASSVIPAASEGRNFPPRRALFCTRFCICRVLAQRWARTGGPVAAVGRWGESPSERGVA